MSIDENAAPARGGAGPDTGPMDAPASGTAADALPRPGRRAALAVPLRALVLRLHFYAGVLVAPFILVAAVTGLLYAWTPQLEQVLYDHELRVPVGAQRIPLHEQVTAAEAAHPEGTVAAVRPATGADQSTRVLLDVAGLQESHRLGVFVDPYTGEVRGALDSYGSSGALPVRSWLSGLHRHLNLGEPGRIYSELAASWMWVVALGGAVLWVARRRRDRRLRALLVPGRAAPGRGRSRSWHGAVGTWALVGLLALSATGLTWSRFAGENVTAVREALAWQTPAVAAEVPASDARMPGVDVGVDRVVRAAAGAGVEGAVEVVLPSSDDGAYTVTQTQRRWPTRADAVAVDPATGRVTDTVRFADFPLMAKLSRWGIDAHMGLLFGVANQLALTALAAGVDTLIVLGYRMWWQRRPTGRGGLAMGRPLPRGAWRALPLWAKAAAAAAAAGVGAMLPLLGLSLLGFLAVDLLVARLRRPSAAGDPAASA